MYHIGDIFAASALVDDVAGISMVLTDESEAKSSVTLYRSDSRDSAAGKIFYRKQLTKFGGRQWVITGSASSDFVQSRITWVPLLVLVGGILSSLALIGYVVLLERRSEVIKALVRERTSDLRKSEERSRSILATAADAIITIDGSGTILSFNPAAERIFGYTADEAKGRNESVLVPKLLQRADVDYINPSSFANPSKTNEDCWDAVGTRKDGTVFPIELTVSEAHMDNATMFTWIVRDVSERKRAEEESARPKNLSEMLPPCSRTV